jgi:hypothetical protein
MPDIMHLFKFAVPREQAYQAIATADGVRSSLSTCSNCCSSRLADAGSAGVGAANQEGSQAGRKHGYRELGDHPAHNLDTDGFTLKLNSVGKFYVRHKPGIRRKIGFSGETIQTKMLRKVKFVSLGTLRRQETACTDSGTDA